MTFFCRALSTPPRYLTLKDKKEGKLWLFYSFLDVKCRHIYVSINLIREKTVSYCCDPKVCSSLNSQKYSSRSIERDRFYGAGIFRRSDIQRGSIYDKSLKLSRRGSSINSNLAKLMFHTLNIHKLLSYLDGMNCCLNKL